MTDNSINLCKLINHIYNMTMEYYFNMVESAMWSIENEVMKY
jgi:hypothetical protein